MQHRKDPTMPILMTDEELTETFGPLPKDPLPNFPDWDPTKSKDVDPNGTDQHNGGAKLDAGKPDMSLLLMFGKALFETAKIGTGGKIKYSRGGWQDVPDGIDRYTAAMLRHVFQEHYEEMDPDLVAWLGEETYHAAAVAWNALARLELMLREKEVQEDIGLLLMAEREKERSE